MITFFYKIFNCVKTKNVEGVFKDLLMTSCKIYLCVVDISSNKYLLILDNTLDEQQNNTKWMFRMYLVWGPWMKGNNTSSRKERAFRLQTIFAGFKNTSNYNRKKSCWEKNIIENHHFPAHTLKLTHTIQLYKQKAFVAMSDNIIMYYF